MAIFKITKQYHDVIKCADFADINSCVTGSFKDLLHLDKFVVETEGGVGGGLTHPHLQHWLWKRVWDFSALGGPTSSVSRRVVKLTVSHYYSAPLPLQKRGYGDEI